MLVRQPPMKMEDDEARNKQIRIIESPNTPKDKVAKLVFQLNLYDLIMGYKKEVWVWLSVVIIEIVLKSNLKC